MTPEQALLKFEALCKELEHVTDDWGHQARWHLSECAYRAKKEVQRLTSQKQEALHRNTTQRNP